MHSIFVGRHQHFAKLLLPQYREALLACYRKEYRKERRCMVQAMENETLTRMTPLYWPTTERSA